MLFCCYSNRVNFIQVTRMLCKFEQVQWNIVVFILLLHCLRAQPFFTVQCHGTTTINAVYTNVAASSYAWIENVKISLVAAKVKIAEFARRVNS